MAFRLEKARRRNWAVYEDDTLLCLTVYKKGARSVIERLRELSERVTRDARKEVVDAHSHGIAMS
jgi:hypothetical protein